jgi:hypothetical protein
MSHSVEPFRVHALPFGDHLGISYDALLQAMIHPTEMHRLLDTAEEQKRLFDGVTLGGLEDLEISALTPHGLMGKWQMLLGFCSGGTFLAFVKLLELGPPFCMC